MYCHLNEKLPSVNSLYWHRGNQKIMKTPAKKLRERIVEAVRGDHYPDTLLKARIVVGGSWYYKNGNIRKRDILNLQKFLIDSVFKSSKLGADDKQIFECIFIKKEWPGDYFIVEIDELKKNKTDKGLKDD